MRDPDVDNYKNIVRAMKYIQGTIGLPLILPIEKYISIKWYVNASFTVYKDMSSHNGVFVNMVTVRYYVKSIKKLNTNSSTEANIF